jgi:hypothetical protein
VVKSNSISSRVKHLAVQVRVCIWKDLDGSYITGIHSHLPTVCRCWYQATIGSSPRKCF